VSMLLGGVLTSRLNTAMPEATPPPLATTDAGPTATASPVPIRVVPSEPAIPSLPDLVERTAPSVVLTEAGNGVLANPGIGAGVVVDRDGHILTNFHVIEGATNLVVRMNDGAAAEATVVGIDPSSDLAVIRAAIEPQRLQP